MKKHYFIIFIVSILFVSCASPKFAVKRMAPARYNISGIKSVGLMNFSSENQDMEDGAAIITNNIENKLAGNGFFDLKHMPAKTNPIIFPDLLAESGRNAGVDAVIFGLVDQYGSWSNRTVKKVEEVQSTGRYRTEYYTESGIRKSRQVEIKNKIIKNVPVEERRASVNFRVYVLRSEDTKYIGRDTIADTKSTSAEGRDDIDKLQSERSMLRDLTNNLTDRFISFITPHEITDYIKLKSSKSVKPGIKLAKKGDWEGAADFWETVSQSNPGDHVAIYNLGAASEYQKNYQKARDYYRDAMRISNQGLYNEAWVRVHDIIGQNEKLKGQLKNR